MRLPTAAMVLLFVGALGAREATAGPALLFDAGNGAVLYAEDADNQWHPASLTKVMTAYLVFQAIRDGKLKLDGKISCSLVANLQPPSKIGLPVGGEMTVDLALQALIVKSANDVAVMLAEAVAETETAFVAKMNETAKRLGMTRTTFVNPNGLPAPDQVTTARDMAKLARVVVAEFPEYGHYWSMPDMRIGKRRLGTHNALLRSFEGADGLKTGFTCDSGFNVVASATRDGKRLMAVVLGESTGTERALRAASLLEHGFQQYGWKSLFGTANLDTMPVPADAKGIISMRESVVSWACGTGRARSAKKGKRQRAKEPNAKAEAADDAAAPAAEPKKRATPAAAKRSKVAPPPSEPSAPKASAAAASKPAPPSAQ